MVDGKVLGLVRGVSADPHYLLKNFPRLFPRVERQLIAGPTDTRPGRKSFRGTAAQLCY